MLIDDSVFEFVRQTLTEWALDGARIELINVSENITFQVDTGGTKYVLRVHRPWYHTREELESELHWTNALRQSGIDVPKNLPTNNGQNYVTGVLPGTQEIRNIGILEWVEGEVLGDIIEHEASGIDKLCCYFKQLGSIAAIMHTQATEWSVPAKFKRHAFDASGLIGEKPFWGRFWELPQLEPNQRNLICRVRDTIAETLNRYGTPKETFSMIHADLHMNNLVVGQHGLHVIDFDDSGFGWHQHDLAVALHGYLEHDSFPLIVAALLEGYRAKRPFDPEAEALLPLFLLIRSVMRLAWVYHRPELGRTKNLPVMIDKACEHAERFFETQAL